MTTSPPNPTNTQCDQESTGTISAYAGILQIPVDTRVFGITISDTVSPLLKVVATGKNNIGTTKAPQYAEKTEYWRDNKLSLGDSEIRISFAKLQPTLSTLDRFLYRFDRALQIKQEVARWTSDRYNITHVQRHLYSASDPNTEEDAYIAVLIEQEDNSLRAITWFKQDTDTNTIFDTDTIDYFIDNNESLALDLTDIVVDDDTLGLSQISDGPWYHSPTQRLLLPSKA